MGAPESTLSLDQEKEVVMTLLLGVAVALMVVGAVMLVAGFGAPALWIGVVTVGIALTAIDLTRGRHGVSS
jgi:hypothetical protein